MNLIVEAVLEDSKLDGMFEFFSYFEDSIFIFEGTPVEVEGSYELKAVEEQNDFQVSQEGGLRLFR